MAVGITSTDELMVRLGPDAEVPEDPHVRLFEMRGRPMRGWVIVDRAGIAGDRELGAWVARGLGVARSLPPKGA